MRSPSTTPAIDRRACVWVRACALALILAGGDVRARTLTFSADTLRQPLASMQELRVELVEEAGHRTLTLAAARLDVPLLGVSGPLDWQCPLARADEGSWNCAGALRLRDAKAGTLAAQLTARVRGGRVELELDHDRTRVAIGIPFGGGAPVQATIDAMPAIWFDRPLQQVWANGRLGNGRVAAKFDVRDDGALDGTYGLTGFAFDSRDGRIAGDRLEVTGSFGVVDPGGKPQLRIDGRVAGGELLFGPVYTKLSGPPVRFAVDARADGGGRWTLRHLEWRDPDVIEIAASGVLRPAASAWLTQLEVDLEQARLPAAAQRYAGSWLAAHGFADLKLGGALSGSLALAANGMQRLAVHAKNIDVRDGSGRFELAGLDGDVDWAASGARPSTGLTWRSAELYRIPLAAGRAALHADHGALMLDRALDIGLLGGDLVIDEFTLRPGADQGERVSAGLALTGVSLPQLSKALGWPEFGGTLGGALPHVGYDGSVVTLDGGLLLDVFDGTLNVTDLRLERPFGVAPSLGADIDFRQLDLKLLTGAFSFGEITGRLGGHVHGLRLLDWKPTAFDAVLRADSGGRISQRAVGSLSSVGGSAGVGGGIQGVVLKMFDTFGYSRLGLSCRLADNVCRMGGIGASKPDSSGGGYTIVEGSGLPRITVVGFQRAVDWPTLVDRLQAATSGRPPIIE
ncbi:MAG TPA: hypothetical protein VFG55_02820 [Rhodanobacteraceae bacterium]|nr:hypothetical protein [Rhodanobacteraceae bacterium]